MQIIIFIYNLACGIFTTTTVQYLYTKHNDYIFKEQGCGIGAAMSRIILVKPSRDAAPA
jgi:hypothetical protein